MRPCKDHDDLGCPMTRINRVDGVGPVPCSIMLIAEAPGKTEDKRGVPFQGKSGSELEFLYLEECAGISRNNIYITNLTKCRTNEKDRDPTVKEVEACSHILRQEIVDVQPRFIGTIGRFATQWVLGESMKMEKVHGFGYDVVSRKCCMERKIMPLYHPAYGLHNTGMIRHIMDDFTNFGKMVRGDERVMWKEKV